MVERLKCKDLVIEIQTPKSQDIMLTDISVCFPNFRQMW